MAASKVCQTTETLEQILVHIPLRELLLSRGVSRNWKTLIETSLPLKQATFRAIQTKGSLTLLEADVEIEMSSGYPLVEIPPSHVKKQSWSILSS